MGTGVSEAAQEMARYKVDEILLVDHASLEGYQPELYASAILQVCERLKPKAILMGDTLTALDLAPRVAFSINTGLLTDCVAIEITDSQVEFIKPVYSSNVMAAYTFASEPYMVTLRSRVEEGATRQEEANADVTSVEVELDISAVATEVMQRVIEEEEGIKLTDADIIVSGGRGIGSAEGFEQLGQLAEVLGAAVGASRPPCDLGWASSKAQVGQTGEKVAPSLYIAVGISGATQHIAGMQGSKRIVAINRDPKANIFRIADYGVVGDFEEVVPAFKEAIREIRKQGGLDENHRLRQAGS
jgi:electron transfer flavoprotein alpha subunit